MEKHFQYAFYQPSAEATVSMICDLPNMVLLAFSFNVTLYFPSNLRRTSEAFFTFYLFAFISLLTGSMGFRTTGAMSRALTGSIAPGATFVLLLMIYTSFVLPIPSMQPWLRMVFLLEPDSLWVCSSMTTNSHARYLLPKDPDIALLHHKSGHVQHLAQKPGCFMLMEMIGGHRHICTRKPY